MVGPTSPMLHAFVEDRSSCQTKSADKRTVKQRNRPLRHGTTKEAKMNTVFARLRPGHADGDAAAIREQKPPSPVARR